MVPPLQSHRLMPTHTTTGTCRCLLLRREWLPAVVVLVLLWYWLLVVPAFRGNAYFNKGAKFYDDAINDYQKTIDLNTNSASAYHNLAVVYEKKGSLPQAVAAF